MTSSNWNRSVLVFAMKINTSDAAQPIASLDNESRSRLLQPIAALLDEPI